MYRCAKRGRSRPETALERAWNEENDDGDRTQADAAAGDTEDAILAQDPVPLARELLVAQDTGAIWVGDGMTPVSGLRMIRPLTAGDTIDGGSPSGLTTMILDGGTPR